MGKKVDPDDGKSPIRPLPLVIGGSIYIAGFLVFVYVVSVTKLPLGLYSPYNAPAPSIGATSSAAPPISGSAVATPAITEPRPQQPLALGSPTPLPMASIAVTSALTSGSSSASGKTKTAPPRTAQSRTPRAEFSPCVKPSRTQNTKKTAPLGANPIIPLASKPITAPAPRPITAPAARPVTAPAAKPVTAAAAKPVTAATAKPVTAAAARGVHEGSVAHAVRSRPPTKRASEPAAPGEEQRGSFVLLLPVPKSRGVGVSNDLDPRTDSRGSLLIHPPAAPTPPALSSDDQSQ